METRLDILLNGAINAPDDVLLMSRLHCHARNVSSIVLHRKDDHLLRAFIAWPGHLLSENRLGKSMPVGIHDHRYFVILRGLAGSVRNTTYEEFPLGQYGGTVLNKWAFESRITNESPRIERLASRALVQTSEEFLTWSSITSLTHWQLHNIDCDGPAAWLVSESSRIDKPSTTLYTVADQVNLEGLYGEFESAESVRDHVREFARIFN